MSFLSTWLIFATYILLTAVAQQVGRYLYAEDGKYRLAFDVRADKTVTVIFDSPTRHFVDGRYPLVPQGGHQFALDFSRIIEGVHYLRNGIRSIYPDVVFRDGDLTTLNFVTDDSLYVMFGGEVLDLVRQGFGLQPGTFLYAGDYPFSGLNLRYTVHANGQLDVDFGCGDTAVPRISYTLVNNDESLQYKSYDLDPPNMVETLKRDVRFVCPRYPLLSPDDLTNVVFADAIKNLGQEKEWLEWRKSVALRLQFIMQGEDEADLSDGEQVRDISGYVIKDSLYSTPGYERRTSFDSDDERIEIRTMDQVPPRKQSRVYLWSWTRTSNPNQKQPGDIEEGAIPGIIEKATNDKHLAFYSIFFERNPSSGGRYGSVHFVMMYNRPTRWREMAERLWQLGIRATARVAISLAGRKMSMYPYLFSYCYRLFVKDRGGSASVVYSHDHPQLPDLLSRRVLREFKIPDRFVAD
ncbi:hypothetical protein FOL47_002236 [Perkinsus chesapeaki]|uniref:Uncharacterized protein n=1 Tax=Perkinsus chesapeaki TaxID=330153 RepID=A0A7J6N094_PERCH|nr:hypothetical protein FOL47_002236 [Perkinsus chesapeaki]